MIVVAVAALLAASLVTWLGGGAIARRLPPRHAVPLLTGLALTVAACTGIALSAMAVLALAQLGPVPRIGHWSASVLSAQAGFPVAVGIAAFVIVAGCMVSTVVRVWVSARALLRAARVARTLRPVSGNLVLVDDDAPTAYAVAGRRGRVVVSKSMLAALPADERRVVLAHEAAHLRYGHHLYLHLAALSAAANPLLRPTVAAIALGVERWADEAAAAEVCDRTTTARGLARAALAQTHPPRALGQLAAADRAVVERVRALQQPALRRRRVASALVIFLAAVCWVAAAAATWRAHELIQLAEYVLTRR
jgi:Zn-dependent protease with chaperone function